MVTLIDSRTNQAIGTLSEAQLQELSGHLAEEWSGDQDYYIDQDTLEMLEEQGLSKEILGLLRGALRETGEADIRWTKA